MIQKDYNTEFISREIRELLSTVDKFIVKKDEVSENFRKVYINCSTNN